MSCKIIHLLLYPFLVNLSQHTVQHSLCIQNVRRWRPVWSFRWRDFCSKRSAPQAGYVSAWLGCRPALRGLELLCVRSYQKFVILKEQKFSQALCSLEQFQHLSIEQYLPFLSRHCLFRSETQVEMICFRNFFSQKFKNIRLLSRFAFHQNPHQDSHFSKFCCLVD